MVFADFANIQHVMGFSRKKMTTHDQNKEHVNGGFRLGKY